MVEPGTEPGVDGSVMGWTQVDTITGPIRANTLTIPSERKFNPGRRGLRRVCRGGRRMTPCKNQPSR